MKYQRIQTVDAVEVMDVLAWGEGQATLPEWVQDLIRAEDLRVYDSHVSLRDQVDPTLDPHTGGAHCWLVKPDWDGQVVLLSEPAFLGRFTPLPEEPHIELTAAQADAEMRAELPAIVKWAMTPDAKE